MAVRAKDIAKQLGVSEATFSLVINGKPGISIKTREKVLAGIRSLGYDYLIQSPGSSDPVSRVIGFVLYKNHGELLGANSFFPLILDGIESTARNAGYSLAVINIEREQIQEQISYITDAHCSGFVIFATEMQNGELEYFEKTGLPYVIFDNYFVEQNINSVKVNNQQGTYLLVKYLHELGHKKIGYLSGGLSINSFIERQHYALQAMESFGQKRPQQYVYSIGYPHEEAEHGMERVLKSHTADDLPTAFLADNDLVSVGAIRAVKKAGYRVPEDFSFVGFDDRPICTIVEPKLTTLRLPRERFGSEAVVQLINTINDRSSSSIKVEINGTLIERESCCSPVFNSERVQ